jgi:cytochrome c oxidase cbb3-type subunit III
MARESQHPTALEDAREERAVREGARQEAQAKRLIKSEQDRLAFGKPTAELEWDGIRKLDMPPPRWWVWTFWACFLFAVVWWALYPSWPGTRGYFPGLLGYDQRAVVADQIAAAEAGRADMLARIGAAEDLERIAADAELRQYAITAGGVAFANNCAPCHGLGGGGQGFFPTLADDDWIWGGTLADIKHTILHGVRSGGEAARDAQMPAFGADQILTRDQVLDVAEYVLSLTGRAQDTEAAGRGEIVFAENCVACHGEGGVGMREVGAPALNDVIWLYGDDKAAIVSQIHSPRHGVMPAFGDRLDNPTINTLAVYVHSLGGGQ